MVLLINCIRLLLHVFVCVFMFLAMFQICCVTFACNFVFELKKQLPHSRLQNLLLYKHNISVRAWDGQIQLLFLILTGLLYSVPTKLFSFTVFYSPISNLYLLTLTFFLFYTVLAQSFTSYNAHVSHVDSENLKVLSLMQHILLLMQI